VARSPSSERHGRSKQAQWPSATGRP
jgi:hypothetical protein